MKNYPLRLAILYFLLASSWIFLSDYLVELLVPARYITAVQTGKGFGFIVLTAIGLFLIVRHYYHRIQANELEYRKLFKDNPHPMWVYDTETLRFLTVNNAAVEKYGYTVEEFSKMLITDIRPREDEDSVLMFVKRVVRKSFHDSGIWRHRAKDGRVFYVKVTSHATTFGSVHARVVLAIDMDEQIIAQQQLQLSERKLKALINNTDDLIWLLDQQKQIITYNDAFRQVLGSKYGSDKDVRMFYLDKAGETATISKWIQYIDRALKGESLRLEEDLTSNGMTRFYDVVINPVYNDDQTIMGVGCFARDITDRKAAEDHVKFRVKQLQEVAWIQSHEVRKPVANILGLLELMRTHHAADAAQQELIEHLHASCTELDQVVRKIVAKSTPSDISS